MPNRNSDSMKVGQMPAIPFLYGGTPANSAEQDEHELALVPVDDAATSDPRGQTSTRNETAPAVPSGGTQAPTRSSVGDLRHGKRQPRGRLKMPTNMPGINVTWVMRGLVLTIFVIAAVFTILWGGPMASITGWGLYSLAGVWLVYTGVVQRYVDKTVDRPVPRMGWQCILHRIFGYVGVTFVPKRGMRDLNNVEKERQFQLAGERNVLIVVFGPKGGVGKSTVVAIMAWLASGCNFLTNLIMDARIKRGQITEWMGLWRREDPSTPARHTTITIRQYMKLDEEGWFDDSVQEQMLLGSPPGRQLLTVASDMVTTEDDLALDPERLRKTIRSAKRRIPLTFAECSDDLFTPMDLMLMDECDIPVLVHRVDSPGSTSELSQGIQMYAGKFEQKLKDHGVLMVLAASRKQKPEDFVDVFHGLIPAERITLVRYSKFFKQDHTDPGHDTAPKRDLSRPPRRTMEIDDMPISAELQFRRAFNDALETLPVTQLNPVRAADGSPRS